MLSLGSILERRAAARRELELRRARKSFAGFVGYVFGFELGDHHRRWCTAVEKHDRIVVLAPVEHGKSTLLSIAYPLFVLGQNPDARIALVSQTATQASKFLAAIREYIARNGRLHEVFPNLRPAVGTRAKWSDTAILVERPMTSKDPSIVALGVEGPLLGARLDLAILDDVLSFDSTFTDAQRQKTISWFRSTLVGRIVAGGRVIAVGTPWHREDLLHTLEASGEYATIRDPAIKANGEPLWPQQWTIERLAQRRREIGELEFARQLLVQAIADGDSRFRGEWIEHAFSLAKAEGVALVDHYAGPCRTFTGVDLAVGTTSGHDETAILTIALLADGRRRVLALEAGRWTAPEIMSRIKATHTRYRSRVRVESNAAQDYVRQFLEAEGIPVEAHTTGRNRNDPAFGIESLAVELEQGLWVVPDAPATRTWARELISYSPRGHAGDRVIASWLAREAARAADDRGALPLGIVRGHSVFGDDGDDEHDDPRNDDGSWVLDSKRPSLPLAPYQRFGSRWMGGAAKGAPALHSATSRPVAVSAHEQVIGSAGGGARRTPWLLR